MSTVATLNYFTLPPDGSRPYTNINSSLNAIDVDRPINLKDRNWKPERRVEEIREVNGDEDKYTLDSNGFQFIHHVSKEKEFPDDVEKLQDYYIETIEAIKQHTSASRVVIFDHTIRKHRPGEEHDNTPQKRHPVTLAHVDQTPQSTVARIHRHLPAEDVPSLLNKRYQLINFWRPIHVPAYDFPLALCDFHTLDTEADLIPTTLKYPERDGETYSVKYSDRHTWYYKRGMTPEEVVLIKCYDSQQDGKTATYTAHTGFIDPKTLPSDPLRQSIELRCLVFYD